MTQTNADMSRHVRHSHRSSRNPVFYLLWMLACALSLSTFNACNNDPPGGEGPQNPDDEKKPGEKFPEKPIDSDETYANLCESSSECESEFCTRLNDTSDDAFCSYKCSEDADCPQTEETRSSCIFALVDNRLSQICAPDDLCIDRDEDGYGSGPGCKGQDCDDNNAAIHPGAAEICDGLDNNCDGLIDVNIEGFGESCDTNLAGVCAKGVRVCEQGRELCDALVRPGELQEICDGLDNDCDGEVDEGPIYPGQPGYETSDGNYIPRLNEPCGPADDSCFEGILICNSESKTLLCELTSSNEIDVPDDTCNYVDENCNGRYDEDYWNYWEDEANHSSWELNGGTVVSYKRNARCTIGQGACQREGFVDCASDPIAPPRCNAEVVIPPTGTIDTCNYFDDDCDGIVDNGFATNLQWDGSANKYVTIADNQPCDDSNNCKRVYTNVESCDSCVTNCNNQFGVGVDPATRHVVPTCELTDATFKATCSFDCLPGYVDFDGVLENGCEFQIDASAIYVASPDRGGNDSSSCGSYDKPCASIAHGLSRAKADNNKTSVLVGEGTFEGGFTIDSSIKLIGGHSSQNWLREKDDNGVLLNTTAIRGGASSGIDQFAVRIQNINGSKSVEVSGFSIEAPDAKDDSGNSIGIWIVNGDKNVTITENTIFGGRGGTGKPGTAGNDGASGKDGGAGKDRENGKSSCSGTLSGGAAGAGSCGNAGGAGAATNCPVANQYTPIGPNDGQAANGQGNGSAQGVGGRSPHHYQLNPPEHNVFGCVVDPANPVPSPEPGGNGVEGNDGIRGTGATNATGTISGNSWRGTSGGKGDDGANGGGGGGGGSSGGIYQNESGYSKVYHYGATGGGGGGGGCGATGGAGGQAGGGSFGILVVGSQSTVPVITDNVLHRGTGGRGGQGGIGGVGGDGGAGGNGGKHITTTEWSRCGQHAANGGDGGRGGHGGGAGGGAGGVAYDIAIVGTPSADLKNKNTFTIPDSQKTGGAGGNGGSGILSAGTNGTQGASGSVAGF